MTAPTPEQQILIDRTTDVLAADGRVLAAWLAGSFGSGRADRYSDVDVSVLVADEDKDRFSDQLPIWCARSSRTPS